MLSRDPLPPPTSSARFSFLFLTYSNWSKQEMETKHFFFCLYRHQRAISNQKETLAHANACDPTEWA